MRIKVRRRDPGYTLPHQDWVEEEIDIDEVFIDSLSAAIAKKIFAAPVPRPIGKLKPLHHSLDDDQPTS